LNELPEANERHRFLAPEWDFILYPASTAFVVEKRREVEETNGCC